MQRNLKVYIVGTFDTKGAELLFIRDIITKQGLETVTVDVAARYENRTRLKSPADVSPEEIAHFSPDHLDPERLFAEDRGSAINHLIPCLKSYLLHQDDIAAVIAVGGSGGTALTSPAMRALPVGLPKLLVSTVASGNTQPYVGSSDVTMMYSVADIAGLNTITEKVLSNAAYAVAGMARCTIAKSTQKIPSKQKPALGLTMFGVTTQCVSAIRNQLESDYDLLVFHATGAGGQAMEKLAGDGQLAGIIDVTTTEIADFLMGGVFSAGEERLDAVIRTKIPYVGSVGALDMVNFGAPNTVPEHYQNRLLHEHNPQVTIMRTSPEECERIGEWLCEKLNHCEGPVRLVLPEQGISLLGSEGMPFHDPIADEALLTSIEKHFIPTQNRQLIRLPYAINDLAFSAALVENFFAIINH